MSNIKRDRTLRSANANPTASRLEVWGYYRLLAIKDLTLNSQRIHGQIPVSDRSLTHLYSACLRRTHSLHPSLSQLKSVILSLFSAPPPLCVLSWFPGHHLHAALCLSVQRPLDASACHSLPASPEKVEPLIDLGPKCPLLVPATDDKITPN